jgi:FtsP/CotA-like multicopper oxidase with cupredoxin domain
MRHPDERAWRLVSVDTGSVSTFPPIASLTRRRFGQLGVAAAGAALLPGALGAADVTLEIAPYTLEASPKHRYRTVAYNGQVPGPLIRMRQGVAQTIEVRNLSSDPEVVHWHGMYLAPEVDGAMEEGTPMIAAGATARYTFAPDPPGLRWFHTHTFAGKNLNKAQYTGQHGFLLIEPSGGTKAMADREVFLALHDWGGRFMGSDDGFMNPVYEASTVNGKMLGFGEPVQVKQGERVLMHVLNSSATEVHWIALAGHRFQVIALDGNAVARPQTVEMLRLAPAERVSAVVEMNAPGVWVLGEVRKHVQAAGMGVVVEYAGATGKPVWTQPEDLVWSYRQFAAAGEVTAAEDAIPIELAFDSKFQGHGNEELWLINGKSYPKTDEPVLTKGKRYRLVMKNLSLDDHPVHLHRHSFEVRRVDGSPELGGVLKDVLLVPAKTTAEVEFVADNPGRTLFHCHQQDHMDRGFMMVFRYA